MAIDVKSITHLISEFRKLQTKDSITPESLGYILQRLADLLATAGTSKTVNSIQTLLNGFKAAGQAVVSLKQGAADRNHILANIKTVDLGNGSGYRLFFSARYSCQPPHAKGRHTYFRVVEPSAIAGKR